MKETEYDKNLKQAVKSEDYIARAIEMIIQAEDLALIYRVWDNTLDGEAYVASAAPRDTSSAAAGQKSKKPTTTRKNSYPMPLVLSRACMIMAASAPSRRTSALGLLAKHNRP